MCVVEDERRVDRAGPLGEQAHRGHAFERLGGDLAHGGRGQREDFDHELVLQAQHLPRGHQDVGSGGRGDGRLHERPHLVEHLLAVVEQEEELGAPQHPEGRLPRILSGGRRLRPQCRGDQHRHLVRSIGRRQVDEADTLAERPAYLARRADGEAGLADPRRTPQRDEGAAPDRLLDLGDELLAPDERRRLVGQLVEATRLGAHGREDGAQAVGHHAVHDDRFGVTADVVATELEQLDVGREFVGAGLRGGVGQQDLTAVPGSLEPGREVGRPSVERSLSEAAEARRDADPDAELAHVRESVDR